MTEGGETGEEKPALVTPQAKDILSKVEGSLGESREVSEEGWEDTWAVQSFLCGWSPIDGNLKGKEFARGLMSFRGVWKLRSV